MEFFSQTELVIPAYQMAMLLLLNTLELLFGRIKLALLTTYLFTLYWGYILNRDYLLDSTKEGASNFTFIYFGFGLFMIILALLGFFAHKRK